MDSSNPAIGYIYLFPESSGQDWIVAKDASGSWQTLRWNTALGAQPSGATLTNAINNALAYYAAIASSDYGTAATKAPTLRLGLRQLFQATSSDAKRARIRFAFAGISRVFDMYGDNGGSAVFEIQQMLQNVDVSDDAELDSLKTQMLSLPQWPV